jgi:uncharacterized membrane protein
MSRNQCIVLKGSPNAGGATGSIIIIIIRFVSNTENSVQWSGIVLLPRVAYYIGLNMKTHFTSAILEASLLIIIITFKYLPADDHRVVCVLCVVCRYVVSFAFASTRSNEQKKRQATETEIEREL